jgi:hypothetical protein
MKHTVDRSDLEDQEDENSRLMANLDRLGEKQQELITEHQQLLVKCRQLEADLMDARGCVVEAMAMLHLVLQGQVFIRDAQAWLDLHQDQVH